MLVPGLDVLVSDTLSASFSEYIKYKKIIHLEHTFPVPSHLLDFT